MQAAIETANADANRSSQDFSLKLDALDFSIAEQLIELRADVQNGGGERDGTNIPNFPEELEKLIKPQFFSDTGGLDLIATAAMSDKFSTLVSAVSAVGLLDELESEGPLTFFAPTDEAFAKLPAGTVEMLLRPENIDQLRMIIASHIVKGRYSAAELAAQPVLTSESGFDLQLKSNGTTMVDDAQVLQADVNTSNGILHVIDRVLIPQM